MKTHQNQVAKREDEEAFTQRPAAWSKFEAMLAIIGEAQHDWVLWMDCDSFVMDFDEKFQELLEFINLEHMNVLVQLSWQCLFCVRSSVHVSMSSHLQDSLAFIAKRDIWLNSHC